MMPILTPDKLRNLGETIKLEYELLKELAPVLRESTTGCFSSAASRFLMWKTYLAQQMVHALRGTPVAGVNITNTRAVAATLKAAAGTQGTKELEMAEAGGAAAEAEEVPADIAALAAEPADACDTAAAERI
jgi:hypothetical protein